jgi:hypothetical protein
MRSLNQIIGNGHDSQQMADAALDDYLGDLAPNPEP